MITATQWRFRATDVTKVYGNGRVRANDKITLEVRPGEVYGLLGPNGAGKSTLVRQVIGLLRPTDGKITLGPYDLVADPVRLGVGHPQSDGGQPHLQRADLRGAAVLADRLPREPDPRLVVPRAAGASWRW